MHGWQSCTAVEPALPWHDASGRRRNRWAIAIILLFAETLYGKLSFCNCERVRVPMQATDSMALVARQRGHGRIDGTRLPMPCGDVQKILKIAKGSKIGILAQSIIKQILKSNMKEAYAQCMGETATAKAAKSVIIANLELQKLKNVTKYAVGKQMVFSPERIAVTSKGKSLKLPGFRFYLRGVSRAPSAGAVRRYLQNFPRSYNASLSRLVNVILDRLEGHDEVVMRTNCDGSLYNAIRATSIAQDVGRRTLSLYPSFLNKTANVQLRCFKV